MLRMKTNERIAFALAFAALAYSLGVLAPIAEFRSIAWPEMLASVAGAGVVTLLLLLRLLPQRYLRLERAIYALFLAGMPFIYAGAAYLSGSGADLALECIGIPIYVGLALYGYYRSCLTLALGIVAHGVGWDAWHHAGTSYIAGWYAWACLLADVSLGFLVYTQVGVQQMSGNMSQADRP